MYHYSCRQFRSITLVSCLDVQNRPAAVLRYIMPNSTNPKLIRFYVNCEKITFFFLFLHYVHRKYVEAFFLKKTGSAFSPFLARGERNEVESLSSSHLEICSQRSDRDLYGLQDLEVLIWSLSYILMLNIHVL